MTLSLEALKKQNAEEEEAAVKAAAELDKKNDDDDPESGTEPDDPDDDADDDDGDGLDDDSDDKDGKSDDDDEDPFDVDSLLKEIDEEDDDASGDVPVSTHIRMKRKLKEKNTKQSDEIKRLETELAASKNGGSATHPDMPKRPQLEDYEDDIGKYEEAIIGYDQEMVRFNYTLVQDEENRKTALNKAIQSREKAVDQHYDRVVTFVKSSKDKISQETYESAEQAVRDSLDESLPGDDSGNQVVDHLIDLIGEGSEKVIFLLGKKPAALATLIELMKEDPTGLRAASYVGQQKERLTKNIRKTSLSPKPAKSARGDTTSSSNRDKSLKRAYDKAHTSGNTQAAFDAKREAKKLEIDTSSW